MMRIPRTWKLVLVALGGLAGLLVLASLAALLLVDVDAYKPRVEEAASRALGMSVTVEGRLHIGLVPGLHVVLDDVRVRNGGSELVFAESARIAIGLRSLLARELRYDGITLKGTRVSIERGRDGRYNFQKAIGAAAAFPALALPRLSFPELAIVYADKKDGGGFEARKCKGELTGMRHPGGASFLMRLSVSGQLACGEVRGKDTTATDFLIPIEAKDGVFDFKPVTMRVFGGQGSGSLRMDRSTEVPVMRLDYSLRKLRIEEVFKAPATGRTVSGLMDFSTTLSMRGRTRRELRQSAGGDMALSGRDLTLSGVDLDKRYSKFEASQSFDLLDVAAVLLAGPAGLAVTKGYDFSSAAAESGGSTRIRTVDSRWKVVKGVAQASDVAMTTDENRFALRGGLDFVDDEFDEVFVALVDANGCAKVRQRIRGPFGKPVVEKVGVMASFAGPVQDLFGRAADLLSRTGVACEVFYSGSVAPPK
jgi:hypothetical protein